MKFHTVKQKIYISIEKLIMKIQELPVRKFKGAEKFGRTCGSDGDSEFAFSLQIPLWWGIKKRMYFSVNLTVDILSRCQVLTSYEKLANCLLEFIFSKWNKIKKQTRWIQSMELKKRQLNNVKEQKACKF